MAKQRVGYALLVLAAAVFSQAMWNRISAVTLLTVLLLPVLSFVLLLAARRGFSAELFCATGEVERGEDWECVVILHGASLFSSALPVLRGSFPIESREGVEEQRMMLSLLPRGETRIPLRARFPYCGEYTVRLDTMELYDVLRIFRLRVKLQKRASVLVLPKLYPLPVLPGSRSLDAVESADRMQRGRERLEISSVRAYHDGDLLRDVHWKLSAKQDELMVREYTEGVRPSAVIALDLSVEEDGVLRCPGAGDAVVEAALAVCMRMLEEKEESLVYWYDMRSGEYRQRRIALQPDFELLMRELAVVPPPKPPPPPEALFAAMGGVNRGAGAVYVSTARADAGLLSALTAEALSSGGKAHLLYVDTGSRDVSRLAQSLEETPVHLWRVDPAQMADSLRHAAEASRM